MIRAIASDNFPPFGNFRIDFPPADKKPPNLAEVHIFTGVNGTGKTRMLSVLAAFLGGYRPLRRRIKETETEFNLYTTDEDSASLELNHWQRLEVKSNQIRKIGDATKRGNVPKRSNIPKYSNWLEQVPAFAYSGIAYISDAQIAVMGEVPGPDRESSLEFVRAETPSKELLQAIVNLKLQAAMDSVSNPKADTRAMRIVRAIELALCEITGLEFRFHVTTYPNTSLHVRWDDADLLFDHLPDGLRSILGWMAHAVVMMDAVLQGTKDDPMETEAVFLLDEIENHLHPAWQRRILPAFQRLFPKSQVFVATHSPFVISSVNHGWIHPFALHTKGKASIGEAIRASEGYSYVSVVEEIMGVKEWFDPETESLLAEFRSYRDAAYYGNVESRENARNLAGKIGERSMELGYIMGRELAQMDRHFKEKATAK